jgi:hypothetical protein
MNTSVECVLDPRRKMDKRKLDFICHINTSYFIHFSCATPIATPNGLTMANGSLPDLQEQWQWDHCKPLVVISLLQQRQTQLRRNT